MLVIGNTIKGEVMTDNKENSKDGSDQNETNGESGTFTNPGVTQLRYEEAPKKNTTDIVSNPGVKSK